MELSPEIVGTELMPYTANINWRGMMNYAASVDDPNPLYFDDTIPNGVIAHPMYAAAVTWQMMEQIGTQMEMLGVDPAIIRTRSTTPNIFVWCAQCATETSLQLKVWLLP